MRKCCLHLIARARSELNRERSSPIRRGLRSIQHDIPKSHQRRYHRLRRIAIKVMRQVFAFALLLSVGGCAHARPSASHPPRPTQYIHVAEVVRLDHGSGNQYRRCAHARARQVQKALEWIVRHPTDPGWDRGCNCMALRYSQVIARTEPDENVDIAMLSPPALLPESRWFPSATISQKSASKVVVYINRQSPVLKTEIAVAHPPFGPHYIQLFNEYGISGDPFAMRTSKC